MSVPVAIVDYGIGNIYSVTRALEVCGASPVRSIFSISRMMRIEALRIGAYSIGGYDLFLIVMAVLVVGGIYALLRFTTFGLVARGTMQNADMAAVLGVNPARVYMITFGLGAALSGLAGGLLHVGAAPDP